MTYEFRIKKGGVADPVYVTNSQTDGVNVQITDEHGHVANVSHGALDIAIQDQTTEIIDMFFHENLGLFTLAAPVAVNDTALTVVSGHGVVAGQMVTLEEQDHWFQSEVTSVGATTINLAVLTDSAFTVGCRCEYGPYNMNVDGSVTPRIFKVDTHALVTTEWDITRILMGIVDDNSMDDGKFGGIAALTNGIVLRIVDGKTKNLFNARTNGELALRAYDLTYADKAPAGLYGLRMRSTFSGMDKRGVTIRLGPGDELQLIVRDDLTGLTSFNIIAQGHVVE